MPVCDRMKVSNPVFQGGIDICEPTSMIPAIKVAEDGCGIEPSACGIRGVDKF